MTPSSTQNAYQGTHRLAALGVRYWNIRALLLGAVVFIVCSVAPLLIDLGRYSGVAWVIAGLTVLSVVIDVSFVNALRFRNSSYTVSAEHVYIATGRVVRKTITIDTRQILNVVIRQGPLLRSMGLANVCFTNIMESDALGPLLLDEAERVRSVVLGSVEEPAEVRAS